MPGRVRVAAPARTPAGFGLFAAATVTTGTDREVVFGTEYEQAGCGVAEARAIACNDATPKVMHSGPPDLVAGDGLLVYDSFFCGPRDDARAIAEQRLNLGAGQAVESAFWTGLVTPVSLADADVVSATALSPTHAVAVLEQALAGACVAGAVLHAPRGAAAIVTDVARRDGNVLRDPLGNAWAFGCGYDPATDPAGHTRPADTDFWVYATGPVTIRQGPVVVSPPAGAALDTATNDMLVLVEQVHVVTVECGVWAVPVNAGVTLTRAGLRSMTPVAAPADGSDVTLTVRGRGFDKDAQVIADGQPLQTTVDSPSQATALWRPGEREPGTVVPVLVRRSDGTQTSPLRFEFTLPSPASVRPGAGAPAPAPQPPPREARQPERAARQPRQDKKTGRGKTRRSAPSEESPS